MATQGKSNKTRARQIRTRSKNKYKKNEVTPVAQARIDAGLSQEEAARKVRICKRYLQRIERTGSASWVLAEKLSHLYGCSPVLFLQGL